jgi:hypothetical protein
MKIAPRIALVGLLLVAMTPAAVAHGWYRHHRHHYGWHHGYAPAVSDYYHHSRQLVGTR